VNSRNTIIATIAALSVMQCSCSRNREVKGEIFIVTAGHESIKLGLVEIRAFEAAQLNPLIESVKKKIAEQEAQLAPILNAADKLESSAKQEDDDIRHKRIEGFKRFGPLYDRAETLSTDAGELSSRVKWHSKYLHSAGPFFEVLPQPIAASKTDSDGKFTMKLPHSGEIVLCAAADRKVAGSIEFYYWMVKVTGNADAPITLSNHNLATSDAPQSLIRVAADAGVKAGSIEDLRSELNKLENQLHALGTDFAAAQQTSPSPTQSLTETEKRTIHTPSSSAPVQGGTDTSQSPALYHYNFRTKSGLIGRDFTRPLTPQEEATIQQQISNGQSP
jgi:hypothetical protein